jgi:phosphate-selective porin OprO/OprP
MCYCLLLVSAYWLFFSAAKAQQEAAVASPGQTAAVEPPTDHARHGLFLRAMPLMRRANYSGEANEEIDPDGTGTPDEEPNPYLDYLWSLPTVYSNSDNPIVQEVSFFGLYQLESYALDSSAGKGSGLEARRARLGIRGSFFQDFVLGGNFDLKTDGVRNSLDVNAIDTLTLAWRPNDNFQILVGKQKAGFTYEYNTSSSRLLTLERSLLVDQLSPTKSPGLALEMRQGLSTYQIEAYSGSDLGEPISGAMALVRMGYDLSERLRVEKGGLQAYYLYSSTADSNNAAPYRNSFSLSMDLQEQRASNLIQAFYADGFDKVGNVWGVTLMPAWFVYRDKLQVVLRYQYADSSNANGLRLQKHYQLDAPDLANYEFGDQYQAGYLGLNWYLYGNKLKLMTGLEYADMKGGTGGGDFSGWTWFSGLRLYF